MSIEKAVERYILGVAGMFIPHLDALNRSIFVPIPALGCSPAKTHL